MRSCGVEALPFFHASELGSFLERLHAAFESCIATRERLRAVSTRLLIGLAVLSDGARERISTRPQHRPPPPPSHQSFVESCICVRWHRGHNALTMLTLDSKEGVWTGYSACDQLCFCKNGLRYSRKQAFHRFSKLRAPTWQCQER